MNFQLKMVVIHHFSVLVFLFFKYVPFKKRFSIFVSQIEYCVAMQAMDAILFLGKYKSKSPQPD